MNRVELLTQVINDASRAAADREFAKKALQDIADNSPDAKERGAAGGATGRWSLDLLGLRTLPSPAPAPATQPTSTAATPAASSETTKPVPEVKREPKPSPVNNERSKEIARLEQILVGARTTPQEVNSFLKPETKQALGIDYSCEMKLRRKLDEAIRLERAHYAAEQAFTEMFQPIVIGKRKFHVDPSVRAEIVGIRDRGMHAIRNCANHRSERCQCFWDGARLEVLGVRERYAPNSAEFKVLNAIWDELEEVARAHVPRRTKPRAPVENLTDSNPEWLGRRRQ